jgi:hypothetical protein
MGLSGANHRGRSCLPGASPGAPSERGGGGKAIAWLLGEPTLPIGSQLFLKAIAKPEPFVLHRFVMPPHIIELHRQFKLWRD